MQDGVVILRALLVWLAIAVLAVANGVFREGVLKPKLGDRIAHVLSTLILSAIVFVVAFLSRAWIGIETLEQGWMLGFAWVAMTLGFEFLAGHFVFGNPWEKILADYRVDRGRIWLLVPICTLFAPPMAVKGIPSLYAIPYTISLVIATVMLLVAYLRPQEARWVLFTLFAYASIYNTWLGLTHPHEYQGFAEWVIVPWYRDVITGPFHAHEGFYIVAIAAGQGITALAWALGGRSLLVGALGTTVFLACIAPLGVGSAFPFSALVIVCGWVLWGSLRDCSRTGSHLSQTPSVYKA